MDITLRARGGYLGILCQDEGSTREHRYDHPPRPWTLLTLGPEFVYLRDNFGEAAAREYLLDESLTHLEQEFSERFIRLHRSVLVARDAIAGFEKCAGDEAEAQWQALLRGIPERLPVSRRQWSLVKSYAKQVSS